MTDEQPRRLTALHPQCSATYTNDPNTPWTNLNGWQVASGTTIFHETQIDLSGYAMDSLTFFPMSVGLQDPGIYTFLPGASSTFSAIQVLDIVTSVPLSPLLVATAQTTGTGAGMLGSLREFETILFGTYRFFTLNTNIPYPNYQQLERSQRFDSGEPTAADKLYSYRIVTVVTSDLDEASYVTIPAARHLIGGVMGEEADLVYMQRLKRSYELANQV